MKPLFNPQMIKKLIGILVILLLVKLLWFSIEVAFTPVQGVNHTEERRVKPLYYRIKLTPNDAPVPPKRTKVVKQAGSIKEIKLLALYHAPDKTVVTVKYKGKSKVLAKGETVNGFVLEGAGSNFALFGKNGKVYKVTLLKPESSKGSATIQTVSPNSRSNQKSTSAVEGEVIDMGDHKIVDRSLVDHYIKNLDATYKNIGIKEVKKGDKLEGFRITFVKRGSPFEKLGVKRGDILKSVNGQELTSYSAAFEAYKHIDDTPNVTLTIQRGNKEMELEYEIN